MERDYYKNKDLHKYSRYFFSKFVRKNDKKSKSYLKKRENKGSLLDIYYKL